jgi:hypothetical protein
VALVEIASINVFMMRVVESNLYFWLCSCCFQLSDSCSFAEMVKKGYSKKRGRKTRELTRV